MSTLNVLNKNQKNKRSIVFSAILLGRASLECKGFGICKIIPIREEEVEQINFDCLAYLQLKAQDTLKIHFLYETMSAAIFYKYFTKEYLRVEEAYGLPLALRQKLGLDKSLSIAPGNYKLYQDCLYMDLVTNPSIVKDT